MKKKGVNKFYKIGFFTILAVLTILIAFPLIMPHEESIPELPKAMLVPYTADWFLNDYTENQIVFYVSMANYGFGDSTDINISCELFQQYENGTKIDDEPEYTTTKTLEKIEKTSTKKFVVTGSDINQINLQAPYLGLCRVSSCKNCEALSDRLL